MAPFRLAPMSELTGLHQQMVNTLQQIDNALDRGDQRAFTAWSGKWRDLTSRCGTLLLKIATAEG